MENHEYYCKILSGNPCSGCDAYEYFGYCGYKSDCIVFELEHFIYEELNWDIPYFLDYIKFHDEIYPELVLIEEKELEEYVLESYILGL